MNVTVQRKKAQPIKNFKVLRDEQGFPVILLDGVEIPARSLIAFSVDVDGSNDPVVTLKLMVESVTLDSYVSVWRSMENDNPAGTDTAENHGMN